MSYILIIFVNEYDEQIFRYVGRAGYASIYTDFQLVIRKYLLPHDDRKSGSRFKAFM